MQIRYQKDDVLLIERNGRISRTVIKSIDRTPRGKSVILHTQGLEGAETFHADVIGRVGRVRRVFGLAIGITKNNK